MFFNNNNNIQDNIWIHREFDDYKDETTEGVHASILDLVKIPFNKKIDYNEDEPIKYNKEKDSYCYCLNHNTYIYITNEEYVNRKKSFLLHSKELLFKRDEKTGMLIGRRSIDGKNTYKNIIEYNSKNKNSDKDEFNEENEEIKVYESTEDYFNGKCRIFLNKINLENGKYESCQNIREYFDKKIYNLKYDEEKRKYYYSLDFNESDNCYRTYIYLSNEEYENKENFEIRYEKILFKNNEHNLIGRSLNGEKEYNFPDYVYKYYNHRFEIDGYRDDYKDENNEFDEREFKKENKEIKVYESIENYFKGKCKIFKNKYYFEQNISDDCENLIEYYFDKYNNVKYDENKKQHYICLDFDDSSDSDEHYKTLIYLTDDEYKNRVTLLKIENKNLLFIKNGKKLIGRSVNGKKNFNNINEFYTENEKHNNKEFRKENKEIKIYKNTEDYFSGKCKIFNNYNDFKNNQNELECNDIVDYYFNKYPETMYNSKKNMTCYCLDYDETDKCFKTYIYLTDHENNFKNSLFEIKNKKLLFKKNRKNNTIIGRGKNEQQEYKNFKEYYEQNKYEDLEEFNEENKEIKIYESTEDYFNGECKIFRNKDDYFNYLKNNNSSSNNDEGNKYYKTCSNIRQYYRDKLNFKLNYAFKQNNFFLQQNIKPYTKEKIDEYKNNCEEYFKKLYSPSEYEIPENKQIPSKKVNYFEKIFIPQTEKIFKLIEILKLYKNNETIIKSKTEDLLKNINKISLIFKDVFLHKCQNSFKNLDKLKEKILKKLEESLILLNVELYDLKPLNDDIFNLFEEYLKNLKIEENSKKFENESSEIIDDYNITIEAEGRSKEFENELSQIIDEYITTTETEKNLEKLQNNIYNKLENFIKKKDINNEYRDIDIKDITTSITNSFKIFLNKNNTEKNINIYKTYLEYSKEELEKLKNCFLKLYEITRDKLKDEKYSNFNTIYNEILNKLKLDDIIKSNGVLAISKIYDERNYFKNVKLRKEDPKNCLVKYDEKNKEYIYILPFGNIIHVKKDEYKDINFNINEKFKFKYIKYYFGEIKEYQSLKDFQNKKCLLYNNILEFKENKPTNCEDIDKEYENKRSSEELENKKIIEKIKYCKKYLNNYLIKVKKDYNKIFEKYERYYHIREILIKFLASDIEKFSKNYQFTNAENFILKLHNLNITDEEVIEEIETFKSFIENKKQEILKILESISKYFARKLDDDYLILIYNITNGEIRTPDAYENLNNYIYPNLKFQKNKQTNYEDTLKEILEEYKKKEFNHDKEINEKINKEINEKINIKINDYKFEVADCLTQISEKCKNIIKEYTENKQMLKEDELKDFLRFPTKYFSENSQFLDNINFMKSTNNYNIVKKSITDKELNDFLEFSTNKISETSIFKEAENFIESLRDHEKIYDIVYEKVKKKIREFESFLKNTKKEILDIIFLTNKYFEKPINKEYLVKIYSITDDKIIIPNVYQFFNYCFCLYIEKEKRYELEEQNFKNQFEKYYNEFINFNLPEEIKLPDKTIDILYEKFIYDLPSLINFKDFINSAFIDYSNYIDKLKSYVNSYIENKNNKYIEKFLKQLEETKNKENSNFKNINSSLYNINVIFNKILFILNAIFKTIYKENIITEKNISKFNIKDLYKLKYNFKNEDIVDYYKDLGFKEKHRETFSIIRTIHKYREVVEYIKIFNEKLHKIGKEINAIYKNFIDENKNYSQKIAYLKNDAIPKIYMIDKFLIHHSLKTQYEKDSYINDDYNGTGKGFIEKQSIKNFLKSEIEEMENLEYKNNRKLLIAIDEIAKKITTDLNLKENSEILKDENMVSNILDLKGILLYLENLTNKEILEYKNFKELYNTLFNKFNNTNPLIKNIKSNIEYNEIIFPKKENIKYNQKQNYDIKEFEEKKKIIFKKIKKYEEYIENFYNFNFSDLTLEEKIIEQTTYLRYNLFYNGYTDTNYSMDDLIKEYTTYEIFGKSSYISKIEEMYKLFYYVETYLKQYYNEYESPNEASIDTALIKNLILKLKENVKNKLNFILNDVTKTIEDLNKTDELSQNMKYNYYQKYELILKKLNEIIDYEKFIKKAPKKYLNELDDRGFCFLK